MSDFESDQAHPWGVFEAEPGRLADRYLLAELVGAGASARVYRARDELLQRDVAVKLYPPGVDGQGRARQRRELSLLSGLNHPNLVKLFDAGEQDGRAYLVMELIENPTLAHQLMLSGPLSVGEVAGLGAALGSALAYIHDRGITHRDVKPANVLVGERPMLTDFGIARLVDTARVTQTGFLIGTLAYLAPEQVNGGQVGTPADVYALGLTLLEALTGRREYEGDGPETAFARLTRNPSIPEGPPDLTRLLRAMTALDPGARPTAVEVAEQLDAAVRELSGVPGALLLGPAAEGTGCSGTKVMAIAAPPAGLTSASASSVASQSRRVRQRRLLAGALVATGLAAAAVGVLSLPSTPAGVTVPAMSVPTPRIDAPVTQQQLPTIPQVSADAPTAAAPAPTMSQFDYGSAGDGPHSLDAPADSRSANKNAKPSKKHSNSSDERSSKSRTDSSGHSDDSDTRSGGDSADGGGSSGGDSGSADGKTSDGGGSSGGTSSDAE